MPRTQVRVLLNAQDVERLLYIADISEDKNAELVRHVARQVHRRHEMSYIVWQSEDVKHQAENMGKTLTEQQVEKVLDLIETSHDCTQGITWETIENAIHTITTEQ